MSFKVVVNREFFKVYYVFKKRFWHPVNIWDLYRVHCVSVYSAQHHRRSHMESEEPRQFTVCMYVAVVVVVVVVVAAFLSLLLSFYLCFVLSQQVMRIWCFVYACTRRGMAFYSKACRGSERMCSAPACKK